MIGRMRVRRAGARGKDSGYMLLVLMLAVTVLTITLLGVARNYRRSIVRDREVEMMHRGDQYSRAIKRYYKKNGSYPVSLEQLEKANNIRYLRKQYKDPMSPDGAWKLVHATDIQLTAATGLAGATAAPGVAQNANPATGGLLGGAVGVAAGQNATGSNTGTGTTGGPDTGGTTGTGTTGTTSNPDQGATSGGSTPGAGTNNNPTTSGQVLGGGLVLGVVSKSKAEGIHSFGDKKKYNEWFFIYAPGQDKGQMLVGPYNPNMVLGAAGTGLGNPATPGAPGSGTGVGTPGIGTSGIGSPGVGSSNPPSTMAPSTPTVPAPSQ